MDLVAYGQSSAVAYEEVLPVRPAHFLKRPRLFLRRRYHPNPACRRSRRVLCVHEALHTVTQVSMRPNDRNFSTHILVPADGFVDVSRRELVKLLVMTEYDDCNINRAKDGKLVRLFEESALALKECSVSKLGSANLEQEKLPFFRCSKFRIHRRHMFKSIRRLLMRTYTDRFLSSLIALISILRRPISTEEI